MVKKKAAPKAKAAKASSPKREKEMLLVGSKTKDALKAHDLNVASDALTGLNEIVHWHIEQAARRAAANGRKTIRPHDFVV
jgi:hypothetical protein